MGKKISWERKLNKENISELIKNKKKFLEYVKKGVETFGGPSAYFYFKVVDTVKKTEYDTEKYISLFSNEYFMECLYATLASWGMHRMDKYTRMAEFEDFKRSIVSNKKNFVKLLEIVRGKKFQEINLDEIKDILLLIFNGLIVMAKRENNETPPKLVANSKIMHFLLPDTVPPIDRGNVLFFLYSRWKKSKSKKSEKWQKSIPNVNKNEEGNLYFKVLRQFQLISSELKLSRKDLGNNKWNTSIPKLVDNAIIGYVRNSKPNGDGSGK